MKTGIDVRAWCWQISLVAALAAAWSATTAWGDPLEDFQRLSAQFDRAWQASRIGQAEQAAVELRGLAEGDLADRPLFLAQAQNALGQVYAAEGRYQEAEACYARCLALLEQHAADEPLRLLPVLRNYAAAYGEQGRYADAESLLHGATRLSRSPAAEPAAESEVMNDLGSLYLRQGRYADAEPLLKRSVAARARRHGPDSLQAATALNRLGFLYAEQGRDAEAAAAFIHAAGIFEMTEKTPRVQLALVLDRLAVVRQRQQDHRESMRLFKRAMTIQEEELGHEHPEVARTLSDSGNLYLEAGLLEDAQSILQDALKMYHRTPVSLRGDGFVATVVRLARLYHLQKQYEEADKLLPLADGAEPVGGKAEIHFALGLLRAESLWGRGARRDALEELERAMDAADQWWQRASGDAWDRAGAFAPFHEVYERAVQWRSETPDAAGAYRALERGRARALLDQMRLRGIDLLAGMDETEARSLRQRQQQVLTEIASLMRKLEHLDRYADLSAPSDSAKRAELLAKLTGARRRYAQSHADLCNVSPAYRLAVSPQREPASVESLQQHVAAQQSLLLEYLFGRHGGWLLIVPAAGSPRLEPLAVGDRQAAALGVTPGPLSAERLDAILRGNKQVGVLERLREAAPAGGHPSLPAALASLWEILVPKPERSALLGGTYRRLIVIPDGTLAHLPFETLVTGRANEPQYLVESGPPILYVPSATTLMNLIQRSAKSPPTGVEPVLTVGNCRYGPPSPQWSEDALAHLAAASRYGRAGGHLKPLPFSAEEITWVSQVFSQAGQSAAWLPGEWATEANVRANVPGRRIVHFACHGLVDQAHGNLFGALALTPGPKADDSQDDGYLSLAEIYELKLDGCELAILSACDTNVGPQQRGEGVWALSRGFLVAGGRRVVASSWLVDDEAAASVVSYFCGAIAQAEKDGKADYALCLHEAKRWARRQEQWKNPYYWGTFVLIGPN